MPQPEKIERNKEIYERRKQGWSFGRLSSFYGIEKPTVYVIVKRLEKREQELSVDKSSVSGT